MRHIALLPWLDPQAIIDAAGPWALLVVCLIVFSETGLLVGFLLPGDTLLVISGLLTHTNDVFGLNIWVVSALIALAAFVGGEVGYFIGHKGGPAIFERKDSGIFSRHNVERTNAFFERFGGLTIVLARFVPIVRTFAPVAAGIGHMSWRRYSIYNLIGAVLWGFGLTMLGYVIAYIPFVSRFVTDYIDLILLAAVAGTALIVLWHFLSERRKARESAARPESASVALDPEVFERAPDGDGRPGL
ncbi:VTT domain-containing protein [Microbacterium betulae]|uniref:VTT domain-containing protein n=1 Tax=Microbacterium betulae TaxID=2981139 RepID=A0AA97I4F6_9MICO|nr:VTT domain-containing protein [Microbacterium sp. AB]WOF21704.1 VTT domain-containing protein [Microbacterium sp. AB]